MAKDSTKFMSPRTGRDDSADCKVGDEMSPLKDGNDPAYASAGAKLMEANQTGIMTVTAADID